MKELIGDRAYSKYSKIISGIYEIKNLNNNKTYIGSSKNIYLRIHIHRKNLRNNTHYNKLLQNDWNEYGENAFDFSVLEKCEVKDLFEREKYYIDLYNTLNGNGYNISPIIKVNNTFKQYCPRIHVNEHDVMIVIYYVLTEDYTATEISLKVHINSNGVYMIKNGIIYKDIYDKIIYIYELYGIRGVQRYIVDSISDSNHWFSKEYYEWYNMEKYGVLFDEYILDDTNADKYEKYVINDAPDVFVEKSFSKHKKNKEAYKNYLNKAKEFRMANKKLTYV